jgi:hypothetical protein
LSAFPLQCTTPPAIEPVSLSDMKLHLRVSFTNDDSLISALISTARDRAEQFTGRCFVPSQWTFALDKFPAYRINDSAPSRSDFDEMGNTTWNGTQYWNRSQTIAMPRGPLVSIDSFVYTNLAGSLITLNQGTDFIVDTLSVPGRVKPPVNFYWPTDALPEMNSVQIKFTAGYRNTLTATGMTVAGTGSHSTQFYLALPSFATILNIVSVTSGGSPVSFVYDPTTGNVYVNTAETIVVTYNAVGNIPWTAIQAIKLMVAAWYEAREDFAQGAGNAVNIPLSSEALLSTLRVQRLGYARS